MNDKEKIQIGVIGTAVSSPETDLIAEKIGGLIAGSGSVLICGGMSGVMESVSRGARKAGGTVVGILPGAASKDANEHVDIKIVTDLGHARNIIIVRSSDAIIAIGGGHGTLSEIAFALKLKVPLIGIKTWDIDKNIHKAASAKEAVDLALKLGKEYKMNYNEE